MRAALLQFHDNDLASQPARGVLVTKLNKIDVLAGLFVILIGVLAIIEALNFDMGSARRMGPGYFPLHIGILLLVIGGGIILEGRKAPEDTYTLGSVLSVRGLLLILAAVISFALMIERFGLVPAVAVAVFLSTLADRETPMKQKLALTAGIPIVCVLIFWLGLDMQVDIVRWRP